MTNLESDELLREVIDQLGEIIRRLPEPAEVKVEPANGSKQVVVTGEGAGEGPSPVISSAKPPAKKLAAKH